MKSRQAVLRSMKICRFCLDCKRELTNIYELSSSDHKNLPPLSLQIMACVGIEVFENDGMPQMICENCRTQALISYQFKTNCKEADDALKLFLATGSLSKPPLQEIDIPSLSERKKSLTQSEQPTYSKSKRIKLEEQPEVITLNYSNAIEITEVPPDCEEESPQNESQDSMEMEQSMEEDEMQEMSSRMNPTLKVKQVKTDCFPCDECNRSFPLKQLLDLHKVNHQRERNFECETCNKKFFTKYDLLKHMKGHSSNKPYICVACNKTFARESLLHRHEKVHVDIPKYLCSQCDRTFLIKEDLDMHMDKHKKDRPYLCTLCGKGFVFKQGLERHLATHEDKPHKCNYCEASFNSSIKLARHVTSHAGLRPYPCKLCGRTFLLSHHLTRHMRSHYVSKNALETVINQYKCDICSMSFKKKDSLINHTAIHSMVNLQCAICNTSFDDAASVKKHINTHLSGLPFPCEKCDYSFESLEQLEEHEVKHAEMEYEEQIEKEVIAETKQFEENEEGEEELADGDEDYEDEGEVAEFTITNDINNPDVVRRSTRQIKVKTYPDFLKDENISENEEEVDEQEQELQPGEEEEEEEDGEIHREEYTIKPIVRSEGTKVYTRKGAAVKPTPTTPVTPTIAKDQVPITIDNITLTNQDLEALPTKKFIDMKIGDKHVRVQKLLVSKNEMLAMAREGKIEISGKTFVFKKPGPASLQPSTALGPLILNKSPSQQKKVYERKQVQSGENMGDKKQTEGITVSDIEQIPAEDVVESLE